MQCDSGKSYILGYLGTRYRGGFWGQTQVDIPLHTLICIHFLSNDFVVLVGASSKEEDVLDGQNLLDLLDRRLAASCFDAARLLEFPATFEIC